MALFGVRSDVFSLQRDATKATQFMHAVEAGFSAMC